MRQRISAFLFIFLLAGNTALHSQPKESEPLPPEGNKKPTLKAIPVATPTPPPMPQEKIIRNSPNLPSEAMYYAEKGNDAFIHDNLEAAKTYYEKVVALAPDNPFGLVNLGAVYYRMKKYPEAEDVLKKAISHQFKTPAGWMTLGLVYMDQERLDEAMAALSFAAAYDPTNTRIHNYLGVIAGRKGWYNGAEMELRKALEADPNSNEANYNLAVFYLDQKPPAIELARRHYRRAIELGAAPDPELEKKLEKQ